MNAFVKVEVYDTANATGSRSLEEFEVKHGRTFQVNLSSVVYLTAADEALQDAYKMVEGRYATMMLPGAELIISAKSAERVEKAMSRITCLQGLR